MTFRYFIDTETTGLEPGSRMVEIAAIRTTLLGDVVDVFQSLVNPGMPIPKDVQAIHGITNEMVKDAAPTDVALDAFLRFIDGAESAAAHNSPYDVGIIGYDLSRVGMGNVRMPKMHDTCAIAKALKRTPNNRLQTLIENYKITPTGEAHRAHRDADACRQLFYVMPLMETLLPSPWVSPYTHCPLDVIAPKLAGLPAAVATGETFCFGYTDAQGKKSDRRIIPYGWAKIGDKIQFHGYCHTRGERRTFNAEGVA